MAKRKSSLEGSWWIYLVPRTRPSFLVGQGVALACAAIAAAIWFELRYALPGAPFNTFFPFIIVATVWGGRRGAFTLMVSGLVFAAMVWLQIRPTPFSGALIASIIFILLGGVTVAIVHALQTVLVRLEAAERRSDMMASEMRHRVGNIMQLVQAIARMTARSSTDLAQFIPRFEGRMKALSEAHHLSSGHRQMPGDLQTLLSTLLAAYDQERLFIRGPPISLDNETAPRLALVIHELATNAAKYGALSVPHGVVKIEWQNRENVLDLIWREEGGPPVAPPTRKGFGTRLISATLSPGDAAELIYPPEGVQCRLRLPLQSLGNSAD
jgi:two-component sensor histidine kinase